MRGGWGIVALVEGANEVSWRMHGTCTELYPSVLRAELTAVLNVLRIALPPVVVHVDNAEVVRGFAEGPEWCTAAGRDGGDLWREVWRRMEDLGGGFEVKKVKAHTEEGDVDDVVISAKDRNGNLQADSEAKRGARLAESLAPVGIAKAELVKGLRWMGWARKVCSCVEARCRRRGGRGRRRRCEGAGRGRQAGKGGHGAPTFGMGAGPRVAVPQVR